LSKSVLGLVFSVASIALMFVPGIGWALRAGLQIGLMLASSVLLGPKKPKGISSGGTGLNAQLDINTPRKMVVGPSNMALDIRYHTFSGSDQERFHQIICPASHAVESIDEIWMENELAWTAAGGVQGRYATSPTGPFLFVTTRTEGNSGNGIAVNSTWASTATLTGCAYVYLQYRLVDGGGERNDSPFAGGVPSRLTIRGKGARLYDPRLDSTVSGGSGAHRADNQATWTYNAATADNPALHLLFYLIGWKIGGKLAVGAGVPPSRIDLPSFITAANACAEPISLVAGGTERRYRMAGILSEGDDRTAVIENICASMNATLRDAGGKLALHVLVNDLATPAFNFTGDDILDNEAWEQTPELSRYFNIVRGRYVNADDTALYQPAEYPEVKLTSLDGVDRITTVDYPLVHSASQAQRLAKQFLQRNQYQGRYSATFGPRALQVNIGDPVTLTHPSLGWGSKLFRIVSQAISREGNVALTMLEEHANIYAWDEEEAAAVVPGAPTIYDPLLDPLIEGINNATGAGTNLLNDKVFGALWTKSTDAARTRPLAENGFALGHEPWALLLPASTSVSNFAISPKVPVLAGETIYFSLDVQRGTTLGAGSLLNLDHTFLAADGTTIVGTSVPGAQQSAATLTAGAPPKAVSWSQVVPAGASYVRLEIDTAIAASSSGSFRVERPTISRVQPGADITSFIDGPTAESFAHSYDNVAEAGQFPRNLTYALKNAAGTITSGIVWTYTVLSGTANGFTNASGAQSISGSGAVTLIISSLATSTATIEVKAVHGGNTRTKQIQLSKNFAAPPSGGGGGSSTSSQTSGFVNLTAAINTYQTISAASPVLSTTLGPGKTQVNINVNLDVIPSAVAGSGPNNIQAKVQRDISSVWTDVGAAFNSTPDADVALDPDTFERYVSVVGVLNQSTGDTGLTAGNTYTHRVQARWTNNSNRTPFYFTGSIVTQVP
jgi:hypothetical protein